MNIEVRVIKSYLIGIEPVVSVMLSQEKPPENSCSRVDRMGNNPGHTAETQTSDHRVQGEEETQNNPQDADHGGRQHEVVHQDLLVLLVQDISSYTQLLQHEPEELDAKTLLSMGNRTLQPILRNNLLIMKMHLETFRISFKP